MKIPIRGQLSKRTDALIGFSGIATLIAIWCLLTYSGLMPPKFLPSPTAMGKGGYWFFQQGWLLLSMWRSFRRVTTALLLVVAIGTPIGMLMGAFAPVDAFFGKVVNGFKSVPTTGITGLVVLWFGFEERGMIVFLFLGAIFFMIIMVRNAVAAVPPEYVRVALDLGANRRQMLWKVLLPGAVPRIWEAITVCNGIMWTYIVLAEYLSGNKETLGLGFLLNIGVHAFQPGQVFTMLALIAIISALTDFAFQSIRRTFLDW